MMQFTGGFNGTAPFLMTFLNRSIKMALPYFREVSLISISFIFQQGVLHFRQIHFMFKLFNLDLCLLQFGTGHLAFLVVATTILQAGFFHLLKAKHSTTNLLIAYSVFQCHLTIILPAGNAFPDHLDTFFQRSFPSLLHVTSAF